MPTLALSQISGLTQQELAGAVFEVMANTAAATDTDVNPHSWLLLSSRDSEPRLAVARSRSEAAT
ncbi:hypothetical protein OG539_42275 [Actinacidiphila glaucinigra]|uniref:hypothetical protein n=1 Tax=Actinacidiphila glaucinigra TaxID=235986 RepID=UPI003247E6AE